MKRIVAVTLVALASLAADCGYETTPLPALVSFRLDAPFCSLTQPFALRLQIDQVVVDSGGLLHDQLSPQYSTPAGSHTLGARLGDFSSDTTVTLAEGEQFTRVVSLYCS